MFSSRTHRIINNCLTKSNDEERANVAGSGLIDNIGCIKKAPVSLDTQRNDLTENEENVGVSFIHDSEHDIPMIEDLQGNINLYTLDENELYDNNQEFVVLAIGSEENIIELNSNDIVDFPNAVHAETNFTVTDNVSDLIDMSRNTATSSLDKNNTPIQFQGQMNSITPEENFEHISTPVEKQIEPEILTEKVKCKGRKRKSNPQNWKRTVMKQSRLCGKEYVNRSGKLVLPKQLKPPCSCRLKCYTRITENERLEIHSKFWSELSWEHKKQYIESNITTKALQRHRPRNGEQEGRRKWSYEYNFIINGTTTTVCKVMFKNTLSVTEKLIQSIQAQKTKNPGGIIEVSKTTGGFNKLSDERRDKIKKHIESFPCYESHYSREKTEKKYLGPELNVTKMYKLYKDICLSEGETPASLSLYRNIFDYEYKLGFHKPSIDTCDTCDSLQLKIDVAENEILKDELTEKLKQHQDEANRRYSAKKADKISSQQQDSRKVVLMVDLQKCLATPYLTNTQSFYLRKLWTLNFTIHNATDKQSHCMIWNETIAGRGGQEMASSLIKWVSNNLKPETQELSIWSDNCGGQNRNYYIIVAYFYILSIFPSLNMITHNFLLRGHTHMEVDGVHSIIERKKKSLGTMKIHTPRDWSVFISTCKEVLPLSVTEMGLEDFLDFSNLLSGKGSPFLIRTKDVDNNPVKISQMVTLQVRKSDIGILYYKTSLTSEEFQSVNLRRNKRSKPVIPPKLNPIRKELKPISKKKFEDLQTLLQWVDKSVHDFYNKLPYFQQCVEFPVISEDTEYD